MAAQALGRDFAVLATSLFVPIDIYELTERVTWIRVGALAINIAAVVYILLSKRLFGLRGGHAAYLAERHETSLLEIEIAGDEPLVPPAVEPSSFPPPRPVGLKTPRGPANARHGPEQVHRTVRQRPYPPCTRRPTHQDQNRVSGGRIADVIVAHSYPPIRIFQ